MWDTTGTRGLDVSGAEFINFTCKAKQFLSTIYSKTFTVEGHSCTIVDLTHCIYDGVSYSTINPIYTDGSSNKIIWVIRDTTNITSFIIYLLDSSYYINITATDLNDDTGVHLYSLNGPQINYPSPSPFPPMGLETSGYPNLQYATRKFIESIFIQTMSSSGYDSDYNQRSIRQFKFKSLQTCEIDSKPAQITLFQVIKDGGQFVIHTGNIQGEDNYSIHSIFIYFYPTTYTIQITRESTIDTGGTEGNWTSDSIPYPV